MKTFEFWIKFHQNMFLNNDEAHGNYIFENT